MISMTERPDFLKRCQTGKGKTIRVDGVDGEMHVTRHRVLCMILDVSTYEAPYGALSVSFHLTDKARGKIYRQSICVHSFDRDTEHPDHHIRRSVIPELLMLAAFRGQP